MSATSLSAGPRPLLRRLRTLSAVVLLGTAAAAPQAAPAVAAGRLHDGLDRAVLAYQSGRFASAQTAFQALARRGVAAAQYNLAVMHLRAEVPRPDRALALRLLTRAAEGGFVTAQYALAQGFENGDFGGAPDLVQANRWYATAAAAGSVDAQVAIGTAYYLGRGARKDAAAAASWFALAAEGGDVGAQYLLASMYEQGDGVALDLRQARRWYDAAARNGDIAAPGKLREVDAKLAERPG